MEKLPFRLWGDPILHNSTKLVEIKEIRSLVNGKIIKKMFDLLRQYKSPGIAANQLGIDKRFIVVWVRPTKRYSSFKNGIKGILINPKIIKRSKNKTNLWEGCLSFGIPGFKRNTRFFVDRNKWIIVEYQDENGVSMRKKFIDGEAIVLQHEIDHLDGFVCAERLVTKKGKVLQGAISTYEWCLKTKFSPP